MGSLGDQGSKSWRILVVFGILNLINIIAVDGSVGMEPVWIGIIGGSLILSFKKTFKWIFLNKYIKGAFWCSAPLFIVIESIIVFQGTEFNVPLKFEMIDTTVEKPQVVVVTSKFHILRSKIIAKELGWNVDGIGDKTLPFLIPTYYLREFFAVVAEVIF